MSEQKHTPGPWRYSPIHRPPIGNFPHHGEDENGMVFWGYSISGSNDHGAAVLPTLGAVHNFPGNIEANARLIAAAPDLLEALDECEDYFDNKADSETGDYGVQEPNKEMSLLMKIRAALAKAEERESA